eukprot:scaffold300209_cov35-Tisochrysis_lutea.AAC.2
MEYRLCEPGGVSLRVMCAWVGFRETPNIDGLVLAFELGLHTTQSPEATLDCRSVMPGREIQQCNAARETRIA